MAVQREGLKRSNDSTAVHAPSEQESFFSDLLQHEQNEQDQFEEEYRTLQAQIVREQQELKALKTEKLREQEVKTKLGVLILQMSDGPKHTADQRRFIDKLYL